MPHSTYHEISPTCRAAGYKMGTLLNGQYARCTNALNDVLNALRDCGAEQVLSLPKIVVVGNQSAGKSSLIEAISRIRVPRSSGACTRCPTEVILRRGDTWSCTVSIRYGQDASDDRNGTVTFASTIQPNEVELILRRAQLAVLNPREDHHSLYTMNERECEQRETSNELKFSKNAVVVDIVGANVDLSLIDLPGIVSSVERVSLSQKVLMCLG